MLRTVNFPHDSMAIPIHVSPRSEDSPPAHMCHGLHTHIVGWLYYHLHVIIPIKYIKYIIPMIFITRSNVDV